MPMTITTSKETIRKSSLVLKTLERKCMCFYSDDEPQSEYVFEYLSSKNFSESSSEDTIAVLGVAAYDDNRYAVFASETLSLDSRNKLFEAFAENFESGDKLIVFTRLDYEAAKEAFKDKNVDIKLVS